MSDVRFRLILLERTDKKGGGVHWDIVLLCLINVVSASIGGPWICGAVVRAVSHVSALTVMSTTHAPGETPKVVEVIGEIGLFS
jgi:solute carrier family 4 anion exchanger 2